MNLYDDRRLQVEPFTPQDDAPVTVYVCGITPYDTTHLGHAFTYTSFDLLIRYLEYSGYPVRYCQNVTDIDDDILRRAAQVGSDWRSLGNEWTAHFIRDMIALNVRPPDFYPRATDVIRDIVDSVQKLLDAGVAYQGDGSVYFSVERFPDYGQLSHLSLQEMLPIANERGNRPDDPYKRDPLDFVLWQAQAPGEPAWDSPWGPGRPGWHIECSTMAARYLGDTIDVHGGGADLVFPHHESEIAQSVCATHQEPFARFWLHTAMVRHDGEKMSKSLGNLIMVTDMLETIHPDALRLYLAGHHYREIWTHEEADLFAAVAEAETLRQASAVKPRGPAGQGQPVDGAPVEAAVRAAMDNDLDTPAARQALAGFGRDILHAAAEGRRVEQAQAVLRRLGTIFGLRLDSPGPEGRVIAGWEAHLTRFI